MEVLKDNIKKAIIEWDKENISSLIEEDIETMSDFIDEELRRK